MLLCILYNCWLSYIYFFIDLFEYNPIFPADLARAAEYMNCIFAVGQNLSPPPPLTSALDISNHLGDLGNMEYPLPSLPLLPGPLWSAVVVTDNVLSMDKIKLLDI